MSEIGAMSKWGQPWRIGEVLVHLGPYTHVVINNWCGVTHTLHTTHVVQCIRKIETVTCKVDVK